MFQTTNQHWMRPLFPNHAEKMGIAKACFHRETGPVFVDLVTQGNRRPSDQLVCCPENFSRCVGETGPIHHGKIMENLPESQFSTFKMSHGQ